VSHCACGAWPLLDVLKEKTAASGIELAKRKLHGLVKRSMASPNWFRTGRDDVPSITRWSEPVPELTGHSDLRYRCTSNGSPNRAPRARYDWPHLSNGMSIMCYSAQVTADYRKATDHSIACSCTFVSRLCDSKNGLVCGVHCSPLLTAFD
jgi:hypothetical protein